MRIYLARHGQTQTGEDGLYLPDSGLTQTGHEQAAELAQALGDTGIELAFTSGLRRAQETAAHYAELTDIVANAIDELSEIDAGDIQSASPEDKLAIINHDHGLDFTAYGGEEPVAFQDRVIKGFDDMLTRASAAGAVTIAAFIHAGTVGAILDHLAGRSFDYRLRRRMPNCAYAIVDTETPFKESVEWQASHLTTLT